MCCDILLVPYFDLIACAFISSLDLPLQQANNTLRQFWFVWLVQSLINVIYTLQNQTPDFTNTRNQEQLLDREKLMMSCPESPAGSMTLRGLSLIDGMSAAAGPLFGEGTCQSRLRRRGGAGAPANRRRSQHSRPRTRKWSAIWSDDELRVGKWNKVQTCWRKTGWGCFWI